MNENERVKELRKLKCLSQKDFAQSIGLSQNHISSIEKGVRFLTERTIGYICRIYNVNRDWLMDGKGKMFNDILEDYNIKDTEAQEFVRMFSELDDETKKYITGLIKKTLKNKRCT